MPPDAAAPSRPAVSFEFFPPADEVGEHALVTTAERLARFAPAFLSVTFGADGSTRERTRGAVRRLRAATRVAVAPHLTCVGAPREAVDALAREYWDAGIRHLVALRGDGAAGDDRYAPAPGGYAYAVDLVAGLKRIADFEISVAGYPETHPEAGTPAADLDCLKAKVEAGASRVIAQFVFEPETFLRFRDRCEAAGIRVPIVPGVLPITRFAQLERFAARCGATLPGWLRRRFAGLEEDEATRRLVAAAVATEFVTRLEREGIAHFHFYTLNRAELTVAICHALGLAPEARADASAPSASVAGRA
ncbi:MAG: methylenetetrahydrofolate reductase [NAD(P)H] [Proteobacteria bacterium]|nr:methylenetetrahydrofolate reductase [NAD(P)H] [Pseudomonadota bacterium]